MIGTFKETLASIQDKGYGHVIVSKTLKLVLWYWTKYILLFAFIPLLLFISVFTFITPQVSRFFKDHLPEVELGLKGGKFYTTLEEPLVIGTQDLILVVDPQGSVTQLDRALTGLMVLEDRLLVKDSEGTVQSVPFSSSKDFHLSKADLVNWTRDNTSLLWGVLILLTLAAVVVGTSIYWTVNFTLFLVWAAGLWLMFKLLKRPLNYQDTLRLVIYASVPSLILSGILSLAPNDFLAYLNFGLFAFFAISWAWNLHPSILITPTSRKIPRKKTKSKK